VTAAAVAVNVAVVAEAATVTEAGTVNADDRLLERVTVEPPEGAALERVTVQVVLEEADRAVVAHASAAGVTGATSAMLAVLVTPIKVPVTTPV
jgi:hypothetical protein